MRKAKFECEYSFVIATSGGMAGASLQVMQKLATQSGRRFDYMDDAVTVDNTMSQASIEKQIAQKVDSNFEPKITEIVKNIAARKQNPDKKAGAITSLFTTIVSRIPNYENVPKKFSIDSKCNKCTICTKVCPSGNITVNDDVSFGKSCTGCLACLHNCPKNAMHMKRERSAVRWRNPDVSLDEIIKANNRMNEMEDVQCGEH